jgi:hypothetical protein
MIRWTVSCRGGLAPRTPTFITPANSCSADVLLSLPRESKQCQHTEIAVSCPPPFALDSTAYVGDVLSPGQQLLWMARATMHALVR